MELKNLDFYYELVEKTDLLDDEAMVLCMSFNSLPEDRRMWTRFQSRRSNVVKAAVTYLFFKELYPISEQKKQNKTKIFLTQKTTADIFQINVRSIYRFLKDKEAKKYMQKVIKSRIKEYKLPKGVL